MSDVQLLLLRHGEVASHRGDVPVTDAGLAHAEHVGKTLGSNHSTPITLLYGGTRRTRETAEAIGRGINDPNRVAGPHDNVALRNPDMYAGGTRVNMVSSAQTLADQVPGMSTTDVEANQWWATFFDAPDRIGWWLQQSDPPGENAADLARRIHRFARSFADPGPQRGRLIVGVTHSPVLRSILLDAAGTDPGEPAYVTGAALTISTSGAMHATALDPLTQS